MHTDSYVEDVSYVDAVSYVSETAISYSSLKLR